jgi:hypothetical protein
MENFKKIPKVVHICCLVLGAVYWMLFFTIERIAMAKNLLLAFLPFVGTPAMFWIIQEQSRDYDKELKELYSNSVYFMWAVRLFFLFIISIMYLLAAIVVLGLVSFVILHLGEVFLTKN